MIKDIILNLERDKSRDSVRDYAISIAEAFDSHIAGVAFADGSGIPGFLTPDFPSQVLVGIIAEQEKAAREAVARFEVAAKRSHSLGGASAGYSERVWAAQCVFRDGPALRSERCDAVL